MFHFLHLLVASSDADEAFWSFPLSQYLPLLEKLESVNWSKIDVDCFVIPFEVLSLISETEEKLGMYIVTTKNRSQPPKPRPTVSLMDPKS